MDQSILEQARADYLAGKYKSIRATAAAHPVTYPTLLWYLNKCANEETKPPNYNLHLSPEQDLVLQDELRRLIRWNINPDLEFIRGLAQRILRQSFDPSTNPNAEPPRVGKRWAERWLKRHPEFESDWLKPQDNNRILATNKEAIRKFFDEYEAIIAEYGIHEDDIYNMDESGFLIGVARSWKVIKFHGTKAPRTRNPNNREFCTLIECISASGRALNPLAILKGKVITTDFVEDLLDDYMLGVSDSGWTNNNHGLYWLQEIFELETANTKGDFRLLIADGYDSHINVEMVNFYADYCIRLLCLPPHSTHLLQPLDVNCFQPMKHYHSQAISSAVQYLDTDFNKLEFLHALDDIRKKTFKSKTIQSAFKKCGLVPFNPNAVLDAIPNKEPQNPTPTVTLNQTTSTSTSISPRTPATVLEWNKAEDKARSLIRRVQFEGESLTPSKCRHLDKVLRASRKQTTKALAVESEIERLRTEIDNRSKRKNRRKFKVQHGGVIKVADVKDILKAKTEADKLQVETRAQRQAYIAEQKAKIKSAEYIYDSDEYLAGDDNCN